MSEVDRKRRAQLRRIETARELEGRGHIDHAVTEFRKAGAPEEAARVLAKVGRLADAGKAIIEGLGVEDGDVSPLDASDRELIAQAAVFFEASHQGQRAEALRAALAAAPPPPPGVTSRRFIAGPSSAPPGASTASGSSPRPRGATDSGSSARPARPTSATDSSPSARPVRAPSATDSGGPERPASATDSTASARPAPSSLRAPSTASGSFRPPNASSSSTSFRPPQRPAIAADSGSFRAPVISSKPPEPTSDPAPPTFRRPRASEANRAAIRPGSDVPVAPVAKAPAVPSAVGPVPIVGDSGGSRAPRATPEAAPARSAPALSASGEAITDYASNRASGWRGADDDALELSIQGHLEAGRKGAAARVARDAGQIGRALAWFEELGLHAQAGACLRQLGRPAEALTLLLRAAPSGPTYRKACFDVIAIAAELGTLSFEVDRFLTGFVSAGPADPDETVTYVELAELYLSSGFANGAKRCLRKVLEIDPEHSRARALEEQLRRELRASVVPPPRVTGATATARGLPALPTLEEFVALSRQHAPRD